MTMGDVEINIESSPPRPLARRPQIPEEMQQEIKGVFELFVSNSNDNADTGTVEKGRVKVMMRTLGYEPRKDQLARLLAQNGISQRATHIKYEEFFSVMTQVINEKDIKEEMMRAFSLFDVDKTGYISFENLRTVAEQLSENMTDAELQEMIQEADLDKDGVVNSTEFLRIMKNTELWQSR